MIAPSEQELTRIARATEQAADYLVLPNLDDPTAFVVVGKRGQTHHVTHEGCDCKDAQYRKLRCRHFWLVRAHVENLIANAEVEKRRAATRARRSVDFPED